MGSAGRTFVEKEYVSAMNWHRRELRPSPGAGMTEILAGLERLPAP
jgi:hypothetical protein